MDASLLPTQGLLKADCGSRRRWCLKRSVTAATIQQKDKVNVKNKVNERNKVNKNQERERSKRVKRGYGKRLIAPLLAFLLSVKDKAGQG